jgi:hypothetical protein
MSNELDPDLLRLFADQPLEEGAFVAAVLARIERARRLRLLRQAGTAAAALLLIAVNLSWLGSHAGAAIHATGRLSLAAAGFLVTPAGWAVSMVLGAWVLARLRVSRR